MILTSEKLAEFADRVHDMILSDMDDVTDEFLCTLIDVRDEFERLAGARWAAERRLRRDQP